jgi:predicted negative regulator of RcsB-dependent stress response
MAKRKPIRRGNKKLEKQLRQPDEFVSWVDRAASYADDHRPLVVAGFIALFTVVAAGTGIVAMVERHQEKRYAAEYNALLEIADTVQSGDDTASIKRVDDLIADTGGKTERARLYLTKAAMLMTAKDYAGAAEAYEGALALESHGLAQDLAAIGLASARMKAGEAAQADASLKGVNGPLASVAKVERVRLAIAQHNYGEAESVATALETDDPSSPAVATAQALVKETGAAPEEPTAEIAGSPPEPPPSGEQP